MQRNNNGFDYDGGYYKIVAGDHLDYRYEIIRELDRGAFGQVVRSYDHKTGKEMAIKINRNSKFDHSSSRQEIEILKALTKKKEESQNPEEKEGATRIVDFIDSFVFRNHFVSNFLLISF